MADEVKDATGAESGELAIDAHVHVWTPDTAKYPLSAGYRREEMAPASFTPEELSRMRPCGVGRVALVQMSFYGFTIRTCSIRSAVFPAYSRALPSSTMPRRDRKNEMRRLKPLGVRGFRIYPRNMPVDRWLEAAGLATMWGCGAAERMAMCCLVNPDALPAIDRMCEKNPDTPVVIDHCGRVGISGEIRQTDLDQLCRLARHKTPS